MRSKGLGHIPRRKRYYCTKCEKFHGRAALKKWQRHRCYRGEENATE